MLFRKSAPVLGALVASALVIGLLVLGRTGLAGPSGAGEASATTSRTAERPDIVLVLMDDFSLELLATMPEGRRMQRAGARFTDAFVVDSLCCPSRAATAGWPRR